MASSKKSTLEAAVKQKKVDRKRGKGGSQRKRNRDLSAGPKVQNKRKIADCSQHATVATRHQIIRKKKKKNAGRGRSEKKSKERLVSLKTHYPYRERSRDDSEGGRRD